MAKKVDEEAANWTKAISGLAITKCGLIISINSRLKGFLKSFSSEQRGHLTEFFENIQDSNLEFKTERGKGYWKITQGCTKSGMCQIILDRLLEKHVSKSRNIVWNPIDDVKSDLHSLNETKMTLPYVRFFNDVCSICGEFNCPFERFRRGMPLFDDTQQNEDVDEYYWQIANMYMFRGKERNHFPNTKPEDTDAALIFKLMKNCTLFSIGVLGNVVDDLIYDDLIEVRNLLMHSPESRLSAGAFEECFNRMESILKESMFSNEYSKKAVSELQQLKGMRIIMTSLTSQQAAMIEEAFKLQQSSVEFDIHVRGSLKNDYVLEGIMKASKQNSMKYARNAGQPSAPPSQPSAPPSQPSAPPSQAKVATLGGAATGAAVGTIAGPPGAAIGAAVGWVLGKLME